VRAAAVGQLELQAAVAGEALDGPPAGNIEALQASPHRSIDIEPQRAHLSPCGT